jgi:hypothetical protein
MSRRLTSFLGTFIMVGAVAWPKLSSTTSAVSANSTTQDRAKAENVKVDGPWVASCKYWAPARTIASIVLPTASVGKSFDKNSPTPLSIGPDEAAAQAPCLGSDSAWGIPGIDKLPDGKSPHITTIIATVPDPLHSHMAMEFDRTIDAYTQAASDARYLTSYFWLPWRLREPSTKTSEEDEANDRRREQRPGLIIFKQVAKPGNAKRPVDDRDHFDQVIYLFLVGESPALGLNGSQLDYALQYERDLSSHYDHPLTNLDPGANFLCQNNQPKRLEGCLAVVGPIYSGSAASLRVGLEKTLLDRSSKSDLPFRVSIAGATSTELAIRILDRPVKLKDRSNIVRYISLGEEGSYEEKKLECLVRSSIPTELWANRGSGQIAIFAEEGTAYGSSRSLSESGEFKSEQHGCEDSSKSRYFSDAYREPLRFLYPRGLSVLRNTAPGQAKQAGGSTEAIASPYLTLSLKDASADDAVIHFGAENSAVSLESELIAITRQLQRARVRYVEITASNMLDAMYLASFIHRACPDARLVFQGSDILFEHGADNEPYMGSLNISPYSLKESISLPGGALHTVPGGQEEAIYNAALLTFRSATGNPDETLLDHQSVAERLADVSLSDTPRTAESHEGPHPLLWATVVGHDAFYSLGIIPNTNGAGDTATEASLDKYLRPSVPTSPSMFWYAICITIICFCVAYSAALLTKDFWSPVTGDLFIAKGDQPKRRAMYLNIGSSMLWCMAFTAAFPVFTAKRTFQLPWECAAVGVLTLIAGLAALVITLWKTQRYFLAGWSWQTAETRTLYTILNLIAAVTSVAVPVLWIVICNENRVEGQLRYVGLFFSYRCLHPESGVSPLTPVLMLLIGWCTWAVLQLLRLRFSWNIRPLLPGAFISSAASYPLYVSDEALSRDPAKTTCLEERMTCLLITRHVFGSITMHYPAREAVLVFSYFVLFAIAVFAFGVQSLERLLLAPRWAPTYYEVLVASLFFPLIMIAITGWLRMVLIWNSFRSSLLNPLEQLPIRFAFNRLQGLDWKSMLSQSGLQERWRDMGRTTESIRQMWNNEDLLNAFNSDPAAKAKADAAQASLNAHIGTLLLVISGKIDPASVPSLPLLGYDLPPEGREVGLMRSIELDYAHFAEALLSGVLLPFWLTQRKGFIEPSDEEVKSGYTAGAPAHILLAEEFLAFRYLSLVRAVLVNLRYLMGFISTAFVLTIVAWNIYPFQPRAGVDWTFTGLLFILGAGVITVFAQMHRNPILSRITNTDINGLGGAFFLRLATFGAVPVFTWLAYQFPGIGNTLLRIIQPGLSALK